MLYLPEVAAHKGVLVLLLHDELEAVYAAGPVGLVELEVEQQTRPVLLLDLEALDVAADLHLHALFLAVVTHEYSLEHEGVPARLVAQELNDALSDHAGSEQRLVLLQAVDYLVDLLVEERAFEARRHELGELFVFHLEFVEGQGVELDEVLESVVEGVDGNALLDRQLDFLVLEPVDDLLHLQDQLVVALLQLQIQLEAPHLLEVEIDRIVVRLEETEESALFLGRTVQIANDLIVEKHVGLTVDVGSEGVVLELDVQLA